MLNSFQIEKILPNKLPEYETSQIKEEFPLLVNGKVDQETLLKLMKIPAIKVS